MGGFKTRPYETFVLFVSFVVNQYFPRLKRTTPKPGGLGVAWEATNVSLSHAAAG